MSDVTVGTAAPPPDAALRLIERDPGDAKLKRGGLKYRPGVDVLVQSFNSWAFKREQPDNLEMLKRATAAAIERDLPLAFVLYWGRGPRAEVAAPERQCLDFLAALAHRVRSQHRPGADITIICTDTHAELNGHSPVSTRRYFAEVQQEAAKRGFRACALSDLVAWAEDRVDVERALERPSPEILRGLIASAAKWYGGGRSPEEGARLYYRANMIEKQAVEAAFPDAIFVTFNGSDLRPLFPDRMPVFYMYSIRRGVAVKPWFMPAEPEEAARQPGRAP
jgi:L-tyrosine isonitrile synthase